ncbi:MAG: hypothetical protein C5S45_00700 [Candidatus Methanocomedens sp.]|nr:MAG: hypothetical protein C5S45_00700 [ANME-2 cluster archaeon]
MPGERRLFYEWQIPAHILSYASLPPLLHLTGCRPWGSDREQVVCCGLKGERVYLVNDLVFEKRGIMAWVHAPSYRFLFFWLLSAKMGTKIVRVATFSIYNP